MRWLPGFVLIAVGLSTPGMAAERIEFRLPPGFSYTFDNVTDSTSVLDVSADGLQSMTVEQKLEQRIRGSVEVLESTDGIPARVRISFDATSGSTISSNGASETTPFALAGQTVEVRVEDERVVSIVDANGHDAALDDETRSVVSELAIAEQAMLPGRPVQAGDEWLADFTRDDRPLTPILTLQVAGFGEQGGRRIAKLDADGTLKGFQEGMDMDGRVSGPIVMDLESGLPLSSRLSGTIAIDGRVDQNGTPLTITGSQDVTNSSSSRIVARAAAGSVASPTRVVADEADDGWEEFQHSAGATLSHPPTWRPEERPEGVLIQPPDAGAAEMIVATGVATNGTTDPAAPDVGAYLDASLGQMLPGLQRTAGPQPVEAAKGQGALYRYAGSLPDGTEVLYDVYVTIENGVALSLSALAPPAALRARTPTLERIFGSMTLGSAPAASAPAAAGGATPTGDDPRLVDMFGGEALAGGADMGVYVNTQLVYVLNADGTLYYGSQSHFSASERDYTGNLKWTATGNTDGSVQGGRWSAKGGFLTILWDSGERSFFAYGFEPDGSLVLRNPTTRKLINFYRRIR